jgi:GTPase SAR1 family protein
MVLPAGITKATGLTMALRDLRLSPHNVVGIGDGENDHAFLNLCECSVAVADAVPMLKARADIVTRTGAGLGVIELIDQLLADDLAPHASRLSRHALPLGTDPAGVEVTIPAHGATVLLAGASGSGKSTLATSLLERLVERAYQFCIVDPEGDYDGFPDAVVLGEMQRPPTVTEALHALDLPEQDVVVNLVGLPLAERPRLFGQLLPGLHQLRLRSGRPHWLIIDEAHHLLPVHWSPAADTVSASLEGALFITVHPDQLSAAVLNAVTIVIGVGPSAPATIAQLCDARGWPRVQAAEPPPGEAIIWQPPLPPRRLTPRPPRLPRRRHQRKYAEGDVGRDRAFVFRGPSGSLNLPARNLMRFLELAAGVDDPTWLHHLRRGEYSAWFRGTIKDDRLAATAEHIEHDDQASADESRRRIREAVERHYTMPEAQPIADNDQAIAAAGVAAQRRPPGSEGRR